MQHTPDVSRLDLERQRNRMVPSLLKFLDDLGQQSDSNEMRLVMDPERWPPSPTAKHRFHDGLTLSGAELHSLMGTASVMCLDCAKDSDDALSRSSSFLSAR